jgi:hypothetical protein
VLCFQSSLGCAKAISPVSVEAGTGPETGSGGRSALTHRFSPYNAGYANIVTRSRCSYDRITVEVEPPTPVESLFFGRIKALFRD